MLRPIALVIATLATAHADPAPRFEITGAHAFGEAELRTAALPSGEGFLFDSSGEVEHDTLDRALLDLTAYYWNRGYANVRVGTPSIGPFHVSIPVEEGEQFTIASVAFSGTLVGDAAAHLARTSVRGGSTFSRDAISRDRDALIARYQDLGYAWASVLPLTHVDLARRTIALTFEIAPGKVQRVERIVLDNRSNIEDETIRYLAKALDGHPVYSATALADIERQILVFSDVSVAISTRPAATPDRVEVLIDVIATGDH
jgi:outer membrane protein insertion porin family